MEFDVRASGIMLCYVVGNSANIDINILWWNATHTHTSTRKHIDAMNEWAIHSRKYADAKKANEAKAMERNVRDTYMYLCQKEGIFFCDIPKHARKHSAYILTETHGIHTPIPRTHQNRYYCHWAGSKTKTTEKYKHVRKMALHCRVEDDGDEDDKDDDGDKKRTTHEQKAS